ncbi:MAG: WYL domain-containing protein, partial [Spirochaetaceae bacterium]|nr:WYL domain-containing protein [Spirochaetaceae bacterium]
LSNLVTTNTDWLEVDFAPWSPEGSGVRELFGTLRDSILKKRQVSFDYFTGDGRTERRTVHPWMLVYRGQAWYLYGWCTVRNAERFFKLSRMVNVEQTKRPATVTIQDAKNDSPPVAANTASLITINVTVSAAKAGFLLDTFFCTQTQVHQDGSLTATFTAPDTDWLISMLLSFGPELKIISPEKVKKQVALLAEKTAELYENS